METILMETSMKISHILNLFCALSLAVGTSEIMATTEDTQHDLTMREENYRGFKRCLGDITEVCTAIGTGIFSTWVTIAFLNHCINLVDTEDTIGNGIFVSSVFATAVGLFYAAQKMPKELLKDGFGREYNVLTFNTIMGLTITNFITLIMLAN
jgi:hypothetical protein